MNLPSMRARDRRFLRWWSKMGWVMGRLWQGDLPDPRAARGRRWELASLLRVLWLGMLCGAPTSRALEQLSADLTSELLGIVRRVPDSTLSELIPELEPAAFRLMLAEQVRRLHRMKVFEADLPFGIVSIDGKTTSVKENLNEYCQRQEGYWLYRVLNATLISTPLSPLIMQIPIESWTNELGMLPEMVEELEKAYGHSALIHALFMDAGFASREDAQWIHDRRMWFIVRIKDNQRELKAELAREFAAWQAAGGHQWGAQQEWEKSQGKEIRRRIWRTEQIAGYLDWPIRQGWVVEVTYRDETGQESPEYRYYVSDIPVGRLSAAQSLSAVRAHWRIENGTHWVADVIWKEDDLPWCRRGNALMVLGLLRGMAINVMRWLRWRYLRRERPAGVGHNGQVEQVGWRELLRWVEKWLTVMLLLDEFGLKESWAGT